MSALHVHTLSVSPDVTVGRLYVGHTEGSTRCYQIEWTSTDIVTCSCLFQHSPLSANIQRIVSSPLHNHVMFASGRYAAALCVDSSGGDDKWHTQKLHQQSISSIRFIRDEALISCESAFLSSSYDGEITYWSIQLNDTGITFLKNRVILQNDSPVYGLDVDPCGVQVSFLDTVIGSHSNSHDVQNNPYLRNNHGRINIIPSPALLHFDQTLKLETFTSLLGELVNVESSSIRTDHMAILRLFLYVESTPPYAIRPEISETLAIHSANDPQSLVDKYQKETKTSFSLYVIWRTIRDRTKVPTADGIPRLLHLIEDSLRHVNSDSHRLWKCLHALYCGGHNYNGIPMQPHISERVRELRTHLLLKRAKTIIQR